MTALQFSKFIKDHDIKYHWTDNPNTFGKTFYNRDVRVTIPFDHWKEFNGMFSVGELINLPCIMAGQEVSLCVRDILLLFGIDLIDVFGPDPAIKIGSSIASFIKARRVQVGLTEGELASKAGVELDLIVLLEEGFENIQMDEVNVVLNLFGCELGVVPKSK